MTEYGVTANGFVRKPYEVILAEINDSQRASISPTLDLSPSSPQGQLNASFARQIDAVWQHAETMYNSLDPDKAQAMALQMLSKLTLTARRAADYSHVILQCSITIPDGLESVTLVSGTHFAAVQGNPESQWTPLADFTTSEDGTFDVVFRSAERGQFTAPAGSVTVISTSVSGWDSVTHTGDAEEGRPADDDATLRSRRNDDVARAGSLTVLAIPADVGQVAGVISVDVFENTKDYYVNGRPPHSVEVVVDDGESPTADNNELAVAILNAVAPGANIVGLSSADDVGTALDSNGNEVAVRFTRVAYRDIHAVYQLEIDPDTYPGDTAFKAAIRAAMIARWDSVGATINALKAEVMALDVPGVIDVIDFAIGLTDTPTTADNIVLGPRQKPSFDVGNIDVTTV